MYSLMETNNIFNDILLSSSVRGNSRFFYQIIGMQSNENEFFNNIFMLDKKLKENNLKIYHKYIGDIPVLNIQNIIETIRNSFKFKDITQKDFVFKKCIDSCDISKSVNKDVYKSISSLFVVSCDNWYMENSKKKNISFDMLVNFGVKMASWLNNVFPDIIDGVLNTNNEISKIIYYGNITAHEAHFLKLLFDIGCDILYINTEKQPKEMNFGQINLQQKFCIMPDFPKEEKIVSYETNALKAQNEVTETYYDTNSIQPWQLQKCKVKTVPLKTTYEEMFDLWNLELNMRPSFKVLDNTVYIPTLCCKINGYDGELRDFTKKIKMLSNTDNCVVYENSICDFVDLNEIQSFANRFSNTAQFSDSNKIKNSSFYDYKYLNLDLQNHILNVSEDLLKLWKDNVISKQDFVLYWGILFNFSKKIVELLQNFDFGIRNPKIIYYHNSDVLLRKSDRMFLDIMSRLGFDIVAITPTAYCDIEEVFDSEKLNMFTLENRAMDLKNPFKDVEKRKSSLLERIFNA